MRDEVKEINRNRQKEGLGAPFHGIKIVVKFENGIGYRPLTEKPSLFVNKIKGPVPVYSIVLCMNSS